MLPPPVELESRRGDDTRQPFRAPTQLRLLAARRVEEFVERGESWMRHIECVYDLRYCHVQTRRTRRTVGKVAIRCGGEVAVRL